jgi:hypothetical protein
MDQSLAAYGDAGSPKNALLFVAFLTSLFTVPRETAQIGRSGRST